MSKVPNHCQGIPQQPGNRTKTTVRAFHSSRETGQNGRLIAFSLVTLFSKMEMSK